MVNDSEKLVRFDWAIRYILRDKSNFDILEGFLTALLNEDIKILAILDTETNQEDSNDKFNRVDLLIEDSQNRKVIIEVQNNRETHYLERLLYGTSKVIVENIKSGELYDKVVKVLSISIVYFNLGLGDDYIYYGRTDFKGIHTDNFLVVKERVKLDEVFSPKYRMQEKNIFPEYYLIRVEKFEDVIRSPIDEWIYMLKHSEVRKDFHSKNIDKAREKLNIMKMDAEARKKYERYLENLAYEKDVVETAKEDGRNEERQNTEKERRRAKQAEKEKEQAEKEKEQAEKEKEQEKQRAERAEKEKEQEKQKLDSAILKMVNRNVFSIEEIADDFNVTVEYIKQILPISAQKTSLG